MLDLLKFGGRSRVTVRILSRDLWRLQAHWLRRTMLCPGPGCPRCALERPTVRGYAVAAARLNQQTAAAGLVELRQDVLDQLGQRGFVDSNAGGWTWVMESREGRPGWKVLGAEQASVSKLDERPLSRFLETLFGLPMCFDEDMVPVTHVAPDPWLASHRRVLLARLNLLSPEVA